MTEIILRITRLLHGTEHQRTDDHFLRTSLHLFQNFLERPRMDFISLAFYDDAEIRDEFEKLSEFLLFRIFVNTIQERHFHPVEVLRDRLVGSEHELLDHLLADRTCPEDDITRGAVLIDKHLCLVEVEIYRAPGFPAVPQYLCKF